MEKHYKIRRDLSIDFMGRKLFRIECTKEMDGRYIDVGELGGAAIT